jgi:hypothetical protein
MRIIIGILGIGAALAFVVYSAVTVFWTAHDMNSQFQQLAGGAAAGMVIFEALGLLFVRQCWANGARLLALGGLALVLAATVYIVRLDLRFHIAGQSDITATREASIDRRDVARSEYDRARNRRNELAKLKTLTKDQREESRRIDKRIAELEPRIWSPEIVASAGMPEASWASRMLSRISTDRQWWTDALMVLGILFWALARMLALPLAVASLSGVRENRTTVAFAKPEPENLPEMPRKPVQPQKDAPHPTPVKKPSRRPRALSGILGSLSRLWAGKSAADRHWGPRLVTETPAEPTIERAVRVIPVSKQESMAQRSLEDWIGTHWRKSPDGETTLITAAHRHYTNWCLAAGFENPLPAAPFVAGLEAYGIVPKDLRGKGKVIEGVIYEPKKRVA